MPIKTKEQLQAADKALGAKMGDSPSGGGANPSKEDSEAAKTAIEAHDKAFMGKALRYVVNGATTKCRCGGVNSKLLLPISHGVFTMNGKALAHAMDIIPFVNVLSFGYCRDPKIPCVPAPVGCWRSTHKETIIGTPVGFEALLTNSFLICGLGGLIEFVNSGQE